MTYGVCAPCAAATRSRPLFCIHMAKKPAATDEGSLLLVVEAVLKTASRCSFLRGGRCAGPERSRSNAPVGQVARRRW